MLNQFSNQSSKYHPSPFAFHSKQPQVPIFKRKTSYKHKLKVGMVKVKDVLELHVENPWDKTRMNLTQSLKRVMNISQNKTHLLSIQNSILNWLS